MSVSLLCENIYLLMHWRPKSFYKIRFYLKFNYSEDKNRSDSCIRTFFQLKDCSNQILTF